MRCDCSCSFDADMPKVCNQRRVKARKAHRCCECGDTIAPGEHYECTTGIWEDTWDTFCTCETCVTIRTDYCGCEYAFGYLAETLWECLGVEL